jgi:hypothetical protein
MFEENKILAACYGYKNPLCYGCERRRLMFETHTDRWLFDKPKLDIINKTCEKYIEVKK